MTTVLTCTRKVPSSTLGRNTNYATKGGFSSPCRQIRRRYLKLDQENFLPHLTQSIIWTAPLNKLTANTQKMPSICCIDVECFNNAHAFTQSLCIKQAIVMLAILGIQAGPRLLNPPASPFDRNVSGTYISSTGLHLQGRRLGQAGNSMKQTASFLLLFFGPAGKGKSVLVLI